MKKSIHKNDKTQIPARRTFFDLPAEEQKKMMLEAAEGSNKLQQDLLNRYEEKFGSQ